MNTEAKPHFYLPNGRRNPEYSRWYQREHPDAIRAIKRKAKEKKRTSCKCAECGVVYSRDEENARVFRYLRVKRSSQDRLVICDQCM